MAALFLAFLILAPGGGSAQQAAADPKATEALFEAVMQNNLAGVQSSLAAGADLTAINEWGLTATDLAVDKAYFEIAHFLLSVRDFRKTAAKETPPPPAPAAPSPVPAAAPLPVVESAPLAAAPALSVPVPPPPAWPTDKPNPFDPDAVAPGSTLSVIGEIRDPKEAPPAPDVASVPAQTPSVSPSETVEQAARQPEPAAPEADVQAEESSSTKSFIDRIIDTLLPWGDTPEAPSKEQQVVAVESLPPSPPRLSPTVAEPPAEPVAPPAEPVAPPAEAPEATTTPPPPQPVAPVEEPPVVTADPLPPEPPSSPEPTRQSAETLFTPTVPAPDAAAGEPGFFDRVLGFFQPGTAEPAALVETAEPAAPVEQAELPAVQGAPEKVELPAPRPVEKATPTTGSPPGAPDTGGFLKGLFAFFGTGKTEPVEDQPSESEEIAGQIMPSPVEKVPLAPVGKKSPTPAGGTEWVVKGVETAQLPSSLPGPTKPKEPPRNALNGIVLTLGMSVKLGTPPGDRKQAPDDVKPCVEKKRGTIAFCVEPVDWPLEILPYVKVDSIMYQGAKTVGRYDNGMASYYHTIYPSDSFNTVVGYYRGRFGEPTETWKRSIAPLASPRRDNPTVIWRSVNPVTKLVSTLEVRKFDDARGSFPDTKRGVILLYHEWSLPVFPQLSTLELMLLRASMMR